MPIKKTVVRKKPVRNAAHNVAGGAVKKTTEEIPRYKLIASHTARRTFITISDDKGVPISATMNVCGIRSIKTYQNYCRLNKETMTQAVIEAWT